MMSISIHKKRRLNRRKKLIGIGSDFLVAGKSQCVNVNCPPGQVCVTTAGGTSHCEAPY